MPKLSWRGYENVEEAARIAGPRIRHLRESRGLSIRALSARARISKTTLMRIERGEPISEDALDRLCVALQTVIPNLMVVSEDWDRDYRIHRRSDEDWGVAFRKQKAPSTVVDFAKVESATERKRLGNLGFVSGFLQNSNCALRGGKLEAAMMELYGDQDIEGFRHSGEEYVYCLQGLLKVTLAKEVIMLQPGDSMIFFSRHRHRYESALPSQHPDEPTKLLMVWMESAEELEAIREDEEC
ncbi:MAG: helix-turn-helix domain-containing protein [Armatimonadota bacterium]